MTPLRTQLFHFLKFLLRQYWHRNCLSTFSFKAQNSTQFSTTAYDGAVYRSATLIKQLLHCHTTCAVHTATHCGSLICIAVCTTFQHSTRYSDQSTGCCPTNRRATPGSGKHLSCAKCPVGPSSWPTQWLPRVRSRGKAARASA